MPEKIMLESPDRKGSGCRKWDGIDDQFGPGYHHDDLISMWIADMDFKVPSCIQEAMHKCVEFGNFGYFTPPEGYYSAFINWEKTCHGYEVKREWIRFSPGIVAAIHWFLSFLLNPNDAYIVLTPVYYPFLKAADSVTGGRKLIMSDLVNTNGVYTIDYEKFERDIVENDVRLFIFCSPHNPCGRVWTREELKALLDICKKHGVYVLSDEIHQDLIIGDKKQIPAATVGEYDDLLITMTAASKTFNLAGLQNSFLIIPDKNLRARFDEYTTAIRCRSGNMLGYVAVQAGYEGGAAWLSEVVETIRSNYEYIRARFAKALPGVVISPLEGTYLAWFDFTGVIPASELPEFLIKKCKIALDMGDWFSPKCANFARMNLATPRKWVEQAADRIIAGAKEYGKA